MSLRMPKWLMIMEEALGVGLDQENRVMHGNLR